MTLTDNSHSYLWVVESDVPEQGQDLVHDLALIQAIDSAFDALQNTLNDLQIPLVLVVDVPGLRYYHSANGLLVQVG